MDLIVGSGAVDTLSLLKVEDPFGGGKHGLNPLVYEKLGKYP
jgi:hypothetical protein